MNVLLTDHMVCPRCGPPFGLVLVAREVADRRVRRGEFGCANCRDSFPVEDGFADMRPQPRSPAPPREGGGGSAADVSGGEQRTTGALSSGARGARRGGVAGSGQVDVSGQADVSSQVDVSGQVAGSAAAVLRIAAGLGLADGSGFVIVWDGREDEAVGLSEVVPEVEVVVTGWGARDFASAGVSAMAVGDVLPFADGVARGVVVAEAGRAGAWRESVRVLAPGGRIVAGASTDAERRMAAAGCTLLARDEEALVAAPRR